MRLEVLEKLYNLQPCPGRSYLFLLGGVSIDLSGERNPYLMLYKNCRQGFWSQEDQAAYECDPILSPSDQSNITCSSFPQSQDQMDQAFTCNL